MSFRSSPTQSRLGNLGVLSIAVIAFALSTMQGCAAPTVTRSSSIQGGVGSVSVGGHNRSDDVPQSAARHPSERSVAERSTARPLEHRGGGFHRDVCRRCSTN